MQAGHVRENEDEEEEKGVMSIFKRKREGCSAATSNSIARSGQVPTSVRRLVKKKRSRIVGNKDTRTHACTHTHTQVVVVMDAANMNKNGLGGRGGGRSGRDDRVDLPMCLGSRSKMRSRDDGEERGLWLEVSRVALICWRGGEGRGCKAGRWSCLRSG